jgi:ectoine hydroxylase-related dioxygenase (phytanoyl-CoA dioxygenase family)
MDAGGSAMRVTMERDLSFLPVPQDRRTRVLTREQLAAYNRDGYAHGLAVFGPEDAARNCSDFDRLLAAYRAAGHDSYQVNNCQVTCASIYDLATHPRVVDAVGDILGDAFACWSTHYFCKLPGETKSVTWHQDAPYWPFTPARTVTMWLAIDDVDEGNGAMRVIPGSHLLGALPMRDSVPEEKNVLYFTVDDAERWGSPVPMILRAGQASLHSDMLLHSSPPNPSPRRRCGVALRYCTLDVRSEGGWNQNSIVIRGSDPTGHWGWVKRRPEGEHPRIGRTLGAE